MNRRVRALWLPMAAVLLPCAFIAVLAMQWLALEREAAGRRGKESAEATAATIGQALVSTLAGAAPGIHRNLRAVSSSPPPFAPHHFAAPISAAFVFDRNGQPQSAPEAVAESPAASLVSRAAAALVAKDWTAAGSLAKQVLACCRADRDEYGIAWVSYAANQLAIAADHGVDGQARRADVIDEIHRLIDEGFLGTQADVMQIRLLAERLGSTPPAASLLTQMDRARLRIEQEGETARAVAAWLATATGDPSRTPVVGPLRRGTNDVAGLWRAPDGSALVMVVARDALAGWLAHQTLASGAEVSLSSDESPADAHVVPLLADITVSIRSRESDPSADRRREVLFMAAAGGGLVLTLLVGYLALRDVSRELSVASLRASFIAGVTHELKTPLTSIRLLAETLRQDRAQPEKRAELLDTVVHETERLSEVVDNVLSSSRIESGTRTYDPKPFSVTSAVRDVLRRFDYVLAKEGFTLDVRIVDVPLRVAADADAFAQAVLNLLGNAVKYSGTSREIQVTVDREGGDVAIGVADRGVGIPESEHRRIFESFYRVPEAAQHAAGAGLGLALVRHFAEAHGGRVALVSQPGSGSTFTLRLPILPLDATASEPAIAHG